MPPDEHDVTDLLLAMRSGEAGASERLMSVVYAELRHIAAAYLSRDRPDHTLQPTALVHEAYLRLVRERDAGWKNRGHFFGIAAQAMRRILIDHARGRGRAKRQAPAAMSSGHVLDAGISAPDALDVIAIDEALVKLEAVDPRAARVVEARFFAGFSVEETAEALDISTPTVKRDWMYARAFLQRELDVT